MKNEDKLKVVNNSMFLEYQLRAYKAMRMSGENRFSNEFYKKRFDILQKDIYKAIEKGDIIYED